MYLDFSFEWIKKGGKLFKGNRNEIDSAYFGWGDSNLQMSGYIIGYKGAADDLVVRALTSDDISIIDTYIFPICFLYRHALELMLKSIFLKYSNKTSNEKEQIIKNVGHSLSKSWKEVKIIIEQYSSDKEKEDIKIAEDYIMQFDKFDKDSFSFRYPITKRLNQIHEEWKYLDLDNLKLRMDELYNYFTGVDESIGECQNAEFEMLEYITGIE